MARPEYSKQTLLADVVPVREIAYENFPDTLFFPLKKWREKLEILSLGHQAQNCVLLQELIVTEKYSQLQKLITDPISSAACKGAQRDLPARKPG